MYDLTRKCIYTHMPKTAGSTIEMEFGWLPPNETEETKDVVAAFRKIRHAALTDHIEKINSLDIDASDFFIFSSVRNPWDMAVSKYYHDCFYEVQRHKNNPPDWLKELENITFDKYIDLKYKKFRNYFLNIMPFLFVKDKMLVNYIIRQESFEDDFKVVLNRFNLKRTGTNLLTQSRPSTIHYRDMYPNINTKNMVEEMGKHLIDMFDYTF